MLAGGGRCSTRCGSPYAGCARRRKAYVRSPNVGADHMPYMVSGGLRRRSNGPFGHLDPLPNILLSTSASFKRSTVHSKGKPWRESLRFGWNQSTRKEKRRSGEGRESNSSSSGSSSSSA